MDVNKLSYLSISENYIALLKGLGKSKYKSLRNINIGKNYILNG